MDDSATAQYTNSFNSNDLKFIHRQINSLCNIYNMVFDKIKYYIIENNFNYNDFKKNEILDGNSGTFIIVDSLNKTYETVLNNPGYMSILYKTLINKVQILMNFVAQLLYTIEYKDRDEWEKSFDIITNDVVDNIELYNTYFKENLQKLHPDIKFINKEYSKNERQDLEKLISDPLMENMYTFSLKELMLYDIDTLRVLFHYLTEIIRYDTNPNEMRKYVLSDGYINKKVLKLNSNNGYIDKKDDKKYVNTEFYYQYKYYVFSKRYLIYYNLIIIPYILRLHYSLKSGIEIDNKFKFSVEYARTNKLSPYVIPQLYNYNDNKKLTESQEYQKNASLYNYIIRQIYSISNYFNSFTDMLETVSIIDTKPIQENSLNMFKLYYIKDLSIITYSSIIKEFEKITHYLDPTEIYTITNLFEFDIAKNNIIANRLNPVSYEDYESGILLLPIVDLIRLLFELYNKDNKINIDSFWNSIDSHLDTIDDYYTRIFQKYKIDKTVYNNEKMLENIEKSIIDYDYDIGDIILYERMLINESLNSFKFSMSTGLIIKPKENIEKLSNFYKYVYTPFLVNMCMKPKEMKMLPISIPMTNLIK